MSIDQFLLSADTTDLNYPEIRPTLDLNFARTKTLDPRITFTRASGGTYIGADGLIKYAGVNEARFDHDPATGESLGLLVEEARTNIKVRSEDLQLDFDYAAIATILQNQIISPDGLNTADGIVANTTFSAHWMDKVFTSASGITASQNICASAFFKKGVGRDIYIWMYEESGNAAHWVSFNFLTETVNTGVTAQYTSGGGVTTGYGVIKYPNDWYRLWIAGYPNTTTTGRRLRVWLSNETGNISSFSGDNISPYVYAWGFQVEVGGFPTSYIPTQASTRTRARDSAIITDKNFTDWYNQNEGTIFNSARPSTNSAYSGFIYLLGSQFNNGINYYRQLDFQPVYSIREVIAPGVVDQRYVRFLGAIGFGQIWREARTLKSAIAVKTYDTNSYVEGKSNLPFSQDYNSILPKLNGPLYLGTLENGSNSLNGTISRFTYWPKRLPNSQLEALTR